MFDATLDMSVVPTDFFAYSYRRPAGCSEASPPDSSTPSRQVDPVSTIVISATRSECPGAVPVTPAAPIRPKGGPLGAPARHSCASVRPRGGVAVCVKQGWNRGLGLRSPARWASPGQWCSGRAAGLRSLLHGHRGTTRASGCPGFAAEVLQFRPF